MHRRQLFGAQVNTLVAVSEYSAQKYTRTRSFRRIAGMPDSLAERGEFELSVPISAQSDYKKLAGFAAPTRIVGIARGSNAGSACPVGNIPKGTFVRGKCANFHLGL